MSNMRTLRTPEGPNTRPRRSAAAARSACAAAALCWALSPSGARAALTENLTTSVVAMALGNAVTADPPGIASIHFNPAGLARLTGDSESFHMFGASIRNNNSFHQPDGFDIG